VYHCVGVFDALAVCSGVFFEDFHHAVVGFLVGPVSLEFEQGLEGGGVGIGYPQDGLCHWQLAIVY
jgi:hypothetical protein